MYVLVLNDMRHHKSETSTMVVRAGTLAQLLEFVNGERVEPYRDGNPHPGDKEGRWCKVFRKSGPLEWFNPPDDDMSPGHHGHGAHHVGTEDEAVERARESYRALAGSVLTVDELKQRGGE
jgi:hypothetical protein